MRTLDNLPLAVYTPDSQLKSPLRLARSMSKDLMHARELAWRLFVRDITAQYRQSIFGILWALIPPLVTGLIFIILQSRNIVNLGTTDIPYPVFALTGTIIWQLFVESINAPLKSVTTSKPILAKINFPYEALVLSAIYTVLFSFVIKLIILIGLIIYFQIAITWQMLLAPIGFFILILFGIGLGLFLTPFGILYSDVGSSLPIVTQLWFFLTPVVYAVPQTYPINLLATLNPVSPLLIGTRDLITKGVLTNSSAFLVVSLIAFVILVFSWILYRISIPILVERISS